eukprot:1270328-Pyramimonas_sp.AAC.1
MAALAVGQTTGRSSVVAAGHAARAAYGDQVPPLPSRLTTDSINATYQSRRPARDVSSSQGESSGRKWGTGHSVRTGEGERWVVCAALPLLAQEDPLSRAGARGRGQETHMPRLFSFLTPDGEGVEAYFHGPFLIVEAVGAVR